MATQSPFHGPNAGYIEELYEQYRQSPDSVSAEIREFFQNWTPPTSNGHQNGHGNGSSAGIAAMLDANAAVGVDQGKIVGKGTHDELMESSEVYREIAQSQLSMEELAS